MKTIAEILAEMEKRKAEKTYERERISKMIKDYGFIETGIWIPGHKMRDFDLFNGYLSDQIYKVVKNSYPDTFTFYAHYSPTEDAFFDIEYYENAQWVDVEGMFAMPVFINYEKLVDQS